ncbi:hypothetical protein [Vibrio parahaemolyticus]|uniref:hypothetical protein n=1 Tax=Vibrio parahaemolyticus TaxID=670 RepID=UPI00112001D0|nr:hypothetical protein [Vibrio parahaemolyticus]TOP27018.1 hypothetical protein CGH19_23285 [Vibrio parahaemolyticus]
MNFDESNNPTVDRLAAMYDALESLGVLSADLEREASVLSVIKNFNSRFKDQAWVLNDYLPLAHCEEAVMLAEGGNLSEAETVLIKGVNDGLSLFMQHLLTAKEFKQREVILNNAKELQLQKNYGAVVPLLLMAIDGISNDIINLGLFAQDSDIGVWDSICQYDDAFTYLQKNFLTKSRTKTNFDEIFVPFRNGILHGRDVNYANASVSAKCWNILYVLRTWYRDKKDEPYKRHKLDAELNISTENEKLKLYLEQFDKRENDLLVIERSGASEVANVFLESWQKKQWGKIVPHMYHLVGKHRGKSASEVKDTYANFELFDYRCIGGYCDTPSSVVLDVYLTISFVGQREEHLVKLRLNYSSDDLLPLPMNHPDGNWGIVQNSLSSILFGRV